MRVFRFRDNEQVRHGLDMGDGRVEVCEGTLLTGLSPTGVTRDLELLTLLAPVNPGKIVGVGLNYRRHAMEHHAEPPAQPLLFFKPPSAIIGPGDEIRVASPARRTDLEAELVVVIGRRASGVSIADATAYIAGYTCGNDVSERTAQDEDKGWPDRSKGFDTFAPIGPCIQTDLPRGARIQASHNGVVVQDSTVDDLIFDISALVSFVSSVVTLQSGDLIFTGTPGGVTAIVPGDEVSITIDGIGTLSNPVAARTDAE